MGPSFSPPNMNSSTHHQPVSLFERLFGHFMRIFRFRIRLRGSLIGCHQANQSQKSLFARLFTHLKKLVAHLLYLPGSHHGQVADQQKDKGETSINAPVLERTIRKRALLIGIKQVREKKPESDSAQEPKPPSQPRKGKKHKVKPESKKEERGILNGPHPDVKAMRSLLEDVYHYATEDILILIDDDDPTHIQPTKKNILIEIQKLVEGAREDDRFFFHFSGHSGQEETDDVLEEDRMNEYILTSDGERIMDDELRKLLVEPLPVKCSLIAVFDSCHSCSLLDLVHFRCNRVYVPWLNKGRRRTNTLWAANNRKNAKISTRGSGSRSNSSPLSKIVELMGNSIRGVAEQLQDVNTNPQNDEPGPAHTLEASQKRAALSILTSIPQNVRFIESPTASAKQCSSPIPMYCHGNCRDDPNWINDNEPRADVVCLSSAQDGELSWEDVDGNSMTQYLVKILRTNPRRTLREVLILVSHDIHAYYLPLHEKSLKYRKDLQVYNENLKARGKDAVDGKTCEMHNFQNPQISSHAPLDMERVFHPSC